MDKYTIDFTDCKYIYDVHQAIKKGLDFPDYYGENWDAFWDCLTDYGKYKFCIEILGIDTLSNEFNDEINMMFDIIKRYREKYNLDLVIKIVYNGDDVFIWKVIYYSSCNYIFHPDDPRDVMWWLKGYNMYFDEWYVYDGDN